MPHRIHFLGYSYSRSERQNKSLAMAMIFSIRFHIDCSSVVQIMINNRFMNAYIAFTFKHFIPFFIVLQTALTWESMKAPMHCTSREKFWIVVRRKVLQYRAQSITLICWNPWQLLLLLSNLFKTIIKKFSVAIKTIKKIKNLLLLKIKTAHFPSQFNDYAPSLWPKCAKVAIRANCSWLFSMKIFCWFT